MLTKKQIIGKYLLLFLFILNKIKTEKFSCKKIFPASYKVFNYKQSSENIITKSFSIKTLNKINNIKIKEGEIKTNICGVIKIPDKCKLKGTAGTAKLLYIPKKINNSENKCIIIKDTENWIYETNLGPDLKIEDQQSLSIKNYNKKEKEEIKLEFFFQCNKILKNKNPIIKIIFENESNKIRVDIESYQGCSVLLSGYYVLEEFYFISGSIFLIFGCFFLFWGRKWQNTFPSVFRSVLLVSFCFFFYFTFIENYFDEIIRIYLLLGLLVCATGVSYLVVSYRTFCLFLLGVFNSLEMSIFLNLVFLLIHPIFSELLFKIFLFFFILVIHGIIFVKNKIIFKIITTSFLGSICILYSSQYFDISKIELFFIFQNNFFFDLNLNIIENIIVITIFICIFILGMSVQKYSRYLETKKFDGSGYHKIDLNF